VAEAPDGGIAAFCQASYNAEEWVRAAEQVGWIEHVGTHPDFARRGLGRALTCEALRRLRAAGAQSALLVTRDDNATAQRVYAALGFDERARSLPGVLRLPPPA
jgi:ribosomal protein S18 acetylase RimI-like enzyme